MQEPESSYVPPQKRAAWTEPVVSKGPIIKNRLTPAEMKARRDKNLFYNCDDKWVRGHKCRGKLFRLSTEGDVFTEVIEEEAEDKDHFVDAVEQI